MGTRPVPSASGRLVLDDESGSGAPGQVFGRVTLSQVAREAGVSLATASRAFNGSRDRTVREDMRQRVLEAAERLRYQPDANAQAMVRGRTTSIGLIVHDIADPYFSSIAAGVGLAADAAGLTLTLASTQYDSAREPRFAELLTRQRARAIVIAGGRIDDDEVNEHMRRALADFRMSGGTVALIGQPLLGVDTVEIANRSGAADLARVLHGLGYRRFGVLRGPTGHLTATDRRLHPRRWVRGHAGVDPRARGGGRLRGQRRDGRRGDGCRARCRAPGPGRRRGGRLRRHRHAAGHLAVADDGTGSPGGGRDHRDRARALRTVGHPTPGARPRDRGGARLDAPHGLGLGGLIGAGPRPGDVSSVLGQGYSPRVRCAVATRCTESSRAASRRLTCSRRARSATAV